MRSLHSFAAIVFLWPDLTGCVNFAQPSAVAQPSFRLGDWPTCCFGGFQPFGAEVSSLNMSIVTIPGLTLTTDGFWNHRPNCLFCGNGQAGPQSRIIRVLFCSQTRGG